MGNFHYEDRVVWDELAPPLQEMLKHVMTSLETLDKLIPVTDNLVKLGNTTVTNNLLKIGTNTTLTNNLLVLGDTTVTNHLKSLSDNYTAINNLVPVSANLVKLGNTTVTNNLLQLSDTTLTNNLKKLGNTTVTNNLLQLGDTTVTNNLKSLSSNYSALNSLVPVAGNLTQLGNSTVTNNLKSLSNNYTAINSLVPVAGNLVQLGDTTLTNNLKKLGDTSVTNNLKSLSNNYTTINSLVPVAGNLTQLGDTTITNNLKKLGDTNITNNLTQLGNSSTSIINNLIKLGNNNVTNNIINIVGDSSSGGGTGGSPGSLLYVTTTGEKGEVVKTNGSGGLMTGEIFKRVKMAGNSTDLATEKQFTTVTLSEIMNEWHRYTHSYGPALYRLDNSNSSTSNTGAWAQRQNDYTEGGHKRYLDKTDTGWIINTSLNMIESTIDGYPVCGFISPTASYNDYMFECKIDTGWDDDNNGIVVGYCKDSNGREHTLTVMRGRGTVGSNNGNKTYNPFSTTDNIDTKFWWGLIYDAGNDTQDILIDLSTTVGTGKYYGGNNCFSYIKAQRNDKTIKAWTTEFSQDGSDTTYVPNWAFTYTLPSTKPSSMPQAEYDNLTTMLTGKNHVGFCVRSSNMAKFSIINQQGIYTTMHLYDLTTNHYWEFDANTQQWVDKGDMGTEIPNRCFLYSEGTNHFFWYEYKGNYTKIF